MDYKTLKQAVITVGGKGTRLKSLTGNTPKPLYPIEGFSCLERCFINFKKSEIKEVFLLTSYDIDSFKAQHNYLSNKYEIDLKIFQEKIPLGECGGLWNIKQFLNEDFLFLGGDLIWDVDIKRINDFHKINGSTVTLATHITSHPYDSDLIIESQTKEIKKFLCKPHAENNLTSAFLGNAGISIINRKFLEKISPPDKPISFFHYLSQLKKNNQIRIFSYNTSEFIKDIGTPDRFKKTEILLKTQNIQLSSYLREQKALFLDRDGTLIECAQKEYILKKEQIRYKKKVLDFIKSIIPSYTICIIVTNQPQISMGLTNFDQVSDINGKIINDLFAFGIKIDLFTLCPHHPHSGFEGEINNLKWNCFCRKPEPGLILAEAYRRNINLEKSLFIGDSINDEIASRKARCNFLNVSEII